MRTHHILAMVLALAGAAACGSSGSGDGTGGGDGGTGGDLDATWGLLDGAFQNDAGVWFCPDPLGQAIACQCNDGVDNDGDGTVDSADGNCGSPGDSLEGTATIGDTGCTNGADDDGDGFIDSADPECTGPLDEDEATFATGISGDNKDTCHQDCWFDGDSGAGNDGCDWRLGCDPVAGPAYDCNMPGPALCNRAQTDECRTFCQTFTPNGCDCFGCCTVFGADGVGKDVILSETCSVGTLNDPAACVQCTKVDDCGNTCEDCEYCLGRPPLDGCTGGGGGVDGGAPGADGGGYTCSSGVTCNPIEGTCPTGSWCLTGCCVPNID